MGTLESPQVAKVMLPQQLKTLGGSATRCYEAAKKIELKFEAWLYHVCELHLGCTAKQTATGNDITANDVERVTTQSSIDYQKETVDQFKTTTKKLERKLDVTTDAYKQASDEFSPGQVQTLSIAIFHSQSSADGISLASR